MINTRPAALSNHTKIEKIGAKLAHLLMNSLLLVIAISGYFIITAKGDPVIVFDIFQLPATVNGVDNLEDTAGKIHFYIAWLLIIIASLHALAALKHHFIDRDKTLSRMLVHHEDH
jgi:cytochrome b561